jgi:hypothetical protein
MKNRKYFPAMTLLLLALIAISFRDSFGIWAVMPVEVPVERLLSNTNQYIQKNPRDAQGYYVLGRIHSLAFAKDSKTIEVNQRKEQPLTGFLPWESIIVRRAQEGPLSTMARDHLLESVRNYLRATELAPEQPMAFLGLGWMLETGAQWAAQLGAVPGGQKSSNDRNAWKESALEKYRKAYALTLSADLKRSSLGPGADSAISLEAGQAIIRILTSRKTTPAENEELNKVRTAVSKLEEQPRMVTPIIFPFNPERSLDDLLATDLTVRFDLAGDGNPEWWPWVKPDTGILVWDPKRTGRVESGLQLFGSVTWWMSWQNGYQPLAALDDDQNGWLRGKELDGLSVWQDRNSNGLSERGEVLPVQSLGIIAIATTADANRNGIFCNSRGIYLNNGTLLPTYDWTPVEVKTFASALRK